MAFHLNTNESFRAGVRRIVRRQIDKALRDLKPSKDVQVAAVHDARKRFKRVRAVLRLARDDLGSRDYRRENDCFRDAARPLTEVRDATALLEALDKLEKRFAGTIPASTFGRIRDDLLASRAAVQQQVLEASDTLRRVRRAIKCARSRVRRWGLRRKSWSAAYGGFERAYRHGHRAFGAVTADPTTENLHEWRKQAKYLGYEIQLFEVILPKAMKKLSRWVQKLTQSLGDDHDLAILRQKLSASRNATSEADGLNWLAEAIDSRRDELRRMADILGRRVYARSPKAFRRQIERLEKCG